LDRDLLAMNPCDDAGRLDLRLYVDDAECVAA
jgi:hypothetical protein